MAVKVSHANEACNEAEGQQSASQPKATVCSEPVPRYRNPTGHSSRMDREGVLEKEMAKAAGSEPAAFPPASRDAAVGSSCTSAESDVEALLAKLRAL